MDSSEDLFRRWRESYASASFHTALRLVEDRLELGAGELFARMVRTRGGQFRLLYEGGEDHALARLSCVYGRPFPRERTLAALESAARAWVNGEGALAYIGLAQARLGTFDNPACASYRLFVADYALNEVGCSPRRLLKALGLAAPESAAPLIRVYDPEEPRVPAGNGRQSGRWTDGDWFGAGGGPSGGRQSPPPNGAAPTPNHQAGDNGRRPGIQTASLVGDAGTFFSRDVAPDAIAGLGELAEGFLAPTLALGLLFIPSPGGSSVETGAAPGQPNVSFLWDREAGELTLTQTIDGKSSVFSASRLAPGGIYLDEQDDPIARVIGNNLIIDWGAASAAQSVAHGSSAAGASQSSAFAQANDSNDPKLCPDPGPDVPHGASEAAIEYQASVTGLPPGLAVFLNGVYFDGCRQSNGWLTEAKGPGYEQFLAADGEWLPWFENSETGAAKIAKQLEAQSKAAARFGTGVEWHVQEKRVADRIRDMAEPYSNVKVLWNPKGAYAN